MSQNSERGQELLSDLAAHAGQLLADRAGLDEEQAAQIGAELADYMRRHWGGQHLYFAKGDEHGLTKRDLEIWRRANGRNTSELASEYGLSRVRIYQILRAVQRREFNRRQGGFDFGDTA